MEKVSFGNTTEQANQLLELVLQGTKIATASAASSGMQRSQIGDQLIALDGQGNSRAIIEITESQIMKFNDVPASFARDEGEGDLSLDYWRKEHERYFRAEGTFSENMLVLCERFKVVEIL